MSRHRLKCRLRSNYSCLRQVQKKKIMFSQTGVHCTKEPSSESQEANHHKRSKSKKIWLVMNISESLRSAPILAVSITRFTVRIKILESILLPMNEGCPRLIYEQKKNKMDSEPVSLFTAQTTINLTVQKVDKLVQRWLMSFDSWTDYLTTVHFSTIHKEISLKFVFKLEDKILNWAKTEVISESLTRREFVGMQLWEFY